MGAWVRERVGVCVHMWVRERVKMGEDECGEGGVGEGERGQTEDA